MCRNFHADRPDALIGHLAQPEAGAVLVTPEGVELPLRAPGWPSAD